jgi:hypothetical protein
MAADEVRGLTASAGGLRLELPDPAVAPDTPVALRFRIVGEDGTPVTDYDVVHARRMHLIVVRRDLTGFQHLHPRLGPDGTWSTAARFAEPGTHRLFADFARDGRQYTLGADLAVEGDAAPRPLPAPATTARTGPYEVTLDREDDRFVFTVTRNGRPVEPQPYLGARGHLVALREGDLAFLHVHPDEDALAFEAALPAGARYRLFLQFRHRGTVRTVTYTYVA